MLDHRFYAGPLGDLIELPDQGKPTSPLTVIGGTHTSLTGAFTRDVFGHLRSWSWTYDALTVEQLQWVEALQLGVVPGPLYLIDPRRPNRLPVDLATGGSVRRDPRCVLPSNNSVAYWQPLAGMPLVDHATLPARRLLRGCLRWTRLVDTTATLEATGPTLDGRLDIPVLPDEPLALTGWVCGSGEVTATVEVRDRAGNYAGGAVSATVTCSPTTWAPIGPVTVTTGPDPASLNAAPLNPAPLNPAPAWSTAPRDARIRLDTTGPPGDVYLTALSLHRTDDPELAVGLTVHCDPVDVADGFRLGGGGPRVVAVDSPASTYLAPGLYSTALTLTERN